MKVYQSWMDLMNDFSQQNSITKVSSNVGFLSSQWKGIDPEQQVSSLVIVDLEIVYKSHYNGTN